MANRLTKKQRMGKRMKDVEKTADVEVDMGITGEAIVMMDPDKSAPKPLSQVMQHDWVIDKNDRIKEVCSRKFMGIKPVWCVTTALGMNLRCASDQKFWCRRKNVDWIPSNKPFYASVNDIAQRRCVVFVKTNLDPEMFKDGTYGDKVRIYRKEVWVRVTGAFQTDDYCPMYGIGVEDSHSFYANGLAVHNCDESEVQVEEGKYGYVLKARGLEIICESLEAAYATYNRLKSYDDGNF